MFFVVDGSYYIFRAFYALREMRNSKGMPTNGLYAFTNMLLNVIRDEQPEYLAIAFDPRGDVFRNRLYPEYKANRGDPPEDLVPQFPRFRDIVRALNIPILEVPDFEADDLIGTVTRLAEEKGLQCMILSGDKDLAQLVTKDTVMHDSMRNKTMDLAAVLERFQVEPAQVADVLGLAGDTSDNIPGVPGIGEKTAGKLIAEFGSVENVLNSIDKVTGKKRKENLTNFADQARLCKELATIRRDVPCEFDLEKLALTAPNFEAFDALCHEFEFRRFPAVVREVYASQVPVEEPESADVTVGVVADAEALETVVQQARDKGTLAVVPLVDHTDPMKARLDGFALSVEPGQAVYVPVGHTDLMAVQLPLARALDVLRPVLEDPSVALVCHDGKWLSRWLARHDVELARIAFDTQLAAYLVDPNRRDLSLGALAREFLMRTPSPISDVVGSGRSARAFGDMGVEQAAGWAGEQAETVMALHKALDEKLGPELREVLHTMELPLAQVLAKLETRGITLDVDRMQRMSVEFHERLDELTKEVHGHAEREFKINSPQQLAVVLFDELNLPVKKKGKSGPSTDASVLEELADLHPIVNAVSAWREVSKLASTYVDALPKLVDPQTGRIHTSFNQAVAATGRLSSSDPNLQNIPVRTLEGRRIREAFIPRDGWTLVAADYSQIELRVLAHMCEDPVLVDAFVRGEDIHTRTAAEVLEIETDAVTSQQRAAAKAINFGLIYGMGVNRLSRETDMSRTEASEYIERYFARISGVKPFMEGLIESARKHGYAETLFGRRRPIPELVYSENRRSFALGERLAKNTPIQGTAADIIKVAMIRVEAAIAKEGLASQMLLTVHDELLFECPPDEVEATRALVVREMEGAMTLRVPLRVDHAAGPHWAALK